MENLGKGTKYSPATPIDDGLSSRESFEHKTKLREDTGDMTQRPKATDKTISSDRGSFKSKC